MSESLLPAEGTARNVQGSMEHRPFRRSTRVSGAVPRDPALERKTSHELFYRYPYGLLYILTLFGGISDHFASLLNPLCGNELTLEVDRISEHPDVPVPFDRLDETGYAAVENGTAYQVSFSEDMRTVSIMPDSVSGILVENTEDYMAYDLNSGLFAGGRFLLWINDGRFEGSTPSMEACPISAANGNSGPR